jgi:hypothetical protein
VTALRTDAFVIADPAFGRVTGAHPRLFRLARCAWWTFLPDGDLDVQHTLQIDEYTDPHHAATVPHTLVLAPGLLIDRVYCGYWFWGRPCADQLWQDLRDLFRRTKADFDPTTDEARAAWRRAQAS